MTVDAGRKLNWDELAAENARLKNDLALQLQQLTACLSAAEGLWDLIGDIKQGHEFWTRAFERVVDVRKRAEMVDEVTAHAEESRKAASVAIAESSNRATRLREFLRPDNFVKTWHEVVRGSISPGLPEWDRVPEEVQASMMVACVRLYALQAEAEAGDPKQLSKIAESIIAEGNELGTALNKIAAVQEYLGTFWGDILYLIHGLTQEGIEFLPPGTIVHNAKPSARPHRPC